MRLMYNVYSSQYQREMMNAMKALLLFGLMVWHRPFGRLFCFYDNGGNPDPLTDAIIIDHTKTV